MTKHFNTHVSRQKEDDDCEVVVGNLCCYQFSLVELELKCFWIEFNQNLLDLGAKTFCGKRGDRPSNQNFSPVSMYLLAQQQQEPKIIKISRVSLHAHKKPSAVTVISKIFLIAYLKTIILLSALEIRDLQLL